MQPHGLQPDSTKRMSSLPDILPAPILLDRPGIGRAYRVQFGQAVAVADGDQDGAIVKMATERILVVDHRGRETWTNDITIARELLGEQYTMF
jgi:hypothetical protein